MDKEDTVESLASIVFLCNIAAVACYAADDVTT